MSDLLGEISPVVSAAAEPMREHNAPIVLEPIVPYAETAKLPDATSQQAPVADIDLLGEDTPPALASNSSPVSVQTVTGSNSGLSSTTLPAVDVQSSTIPVTQKPAAAVGDPSLAELDMLGEAALASKTPLSPSAETGVSGEQMKSKMEERKAKVEAQDDDLLSF
jgi:hypothetical protein